MRVALIREQDIDNAPGICASIFVQGCTHRCPGCFNQETWDFNGGEEFTWRVENDFIDICNKPYIKNVCILGGEPLDQGYPMLKLIDRLRKEVGKPIWLWTGYRYENLFVQTGDDTLNKVLQVRRDIVSKVDVLVDGEFVAELADKSLRFAGSTNQRVIDINKSMIEEKTVLYEY